jgi:WXG100 family type VII secretion target
VTRYAVDLELLDSTTRELESLVRLVDARLADLERVVGDLHATWTGQSASAHARAHREWATGARRMRDGLAAMRAAAGVAHGGYERAAAANAQMWSSTR